MTFPHNITTPQAASSAVCGDRAAPAEPVVPSVTRSAGGVIAPGTEHLAEVTAICPHRSVTLSVRVVLVASGARSAPRDLHLRGGNVTRRGLGRRRHGSLGRLLGTAARPEREFSLCTVSRDEPPGA